MEACIVSGAIGIPVHAKKNTQYNGGHEIYTALVKKSTIISWSTMQLLNVLMRHDWPCKGSLCRGLQVCTNSIFNVSDVLHEQLEQTPAVVITTMGCNVYFHQEDNNMET